MEFSVSDIKKKFFTFSQKKAFLIFQETSYISGNNFLLSDKKKKKKKKLGKNVLFFSRKWNFLVPILKN